MTPKIPKTPTDQPRYVKLRYFSIILVPVAIFLMHSVISDYMIAKDLKVPADILVEGQHWVEAAGRYRFLAATWFYSALTVLAVALLLRTLARPTVLSTRLAAIAIWFFVIALAVLPSLLNGFALDGSHVFDRLGSELFKAALSRGEVPGCATAEDTWLVGRCGEMPVVTLFDRVMDFVNIMAGLGVGALIVGMILCLDQRACKDVEEEAALLAENLNNMRYQLYLSGLILTFGMLFATSWMYWPLQLVSQAEQAGFAAVLRSAALYTGTYFSLLILSFYLPVALILDDRVRRLSRKAGGKIEAREELDIDAWKASHGLKEGAGDYLKAGFALTAPILAAFAGGISPLAL